jgi:hypothetical protein
VDDNNEVKTEDGDDMDFRQIVGLESRCKVLFGDYPTFPLIFTGGMLVSIRQTIPFISTRVKGQDEN